MYFLDIRVDKVTDRHTGKLTVILCTPTGDEVIKIGHNAQIIAIKTFKITYKTAQNNYKLYLET